MTFATQSASYLITNLGTVPERIVHCLLLTVTEPIFAILKLTATEPIFKKLTLARHPPKKIVSQTVRQTG